MVTGLSDISFLRTGFKMNVFMTIWEEFRNVLYKNGDVSNSLFVTGTCDGIAKLTGESAEDLVTNKSLTNRRIYMFEEVLTEKRTTYVEENEIIPK